RPALSVAHLAVREMPGAGTTDELLAESGIDADAIAAAARRLLAWLLPVRPQRRRMAPLARLNRLCTMMPRTRITMMIAVALAMSAWSWSVDSSTPSDGWL